MCGEKVGQMFGQSTGTAESRVGKRLRRSNLQVGAAGFEPATSCSQSRRASPYIPSSC